MCAGFAPHDFDYIGVVEDERPIEFINRWRTHVLHAVGILLSQKADVRSLALTSISPPIEVCRTLAPIVVRL